MPARKPLAQPTPHSWAIESWPPHVYPHSPGKGRYLVRAHRSELMAAGVLTRIGRDIVVLGAPYAVWLASQSSRVESFRIAPNEPAQTAA